MKKLSILTLVLASLFFGLSAQQPQDPNLMTINGKDIKLSEFEYIYNKNNSNNLIDKKTLEEYVDLYVIFKMKVEEAIAQGLDTTKAFKTELAMYRNQLAQQYLQDEEGLELLMKEAYDRKVEEREVSHIIIRIEGDGTSADTLKAYNRAMEAYKLAQKEDFAKVAQAYSDDPNVARTNGHLGWVSAGRTPYNFETLVYNTEVGSVALPIRTFIGYHIVKVTEKRNSQGEVRVSHIMLANDDDKKPEEIEAAVDSIYQLVLAGEDFAELAKQNSQDPGSASKGGELPWFGSGQMVPQFEKAAFALQTEGEISAPIRSNYGWHIIKLLGKKPIATYEEQRQSLKSMVEQSDRAVEIENYFVEKLKKEYHFRLNEGSLQEIFDLTDKYAMSDSIFKKEAMRLNKNLFGFANRNFSQSDFAQTFLSAVDDYRGVKTDFIKEQLRNYVNKQLIDYEKSELANKYPDYKNLLQEYHDGILLFEVMNNEVWEKASLDKEGLEKFFEDNKSKYKWDEPRYKGRIVYAKDKATLKAVKKVIKIANPDSIDSYINKRFNDSIKYVRSEKGLWKKGINPIIDKKIFKVKSEIKIDENFPYYFVVGKLQKQYPEDYLDVRGVVTADYQDYLEQNWIAYLKQKYRVMIDQNVMKVVKKN